MINTAYPIDAVVAWMNPLCLMPCFVDIFTKFVVNKKLYSYKVKQHVRTHWSDNLTVGDGN